MGSANFHVNCMWINRKRHTQVYTHSLPSVAMYSPVAVPSLRSRCCPRASCPQLSKTDSLIGGTSPTNSRPRVEEQRNTMTTRLHCFSAAQLGVWLCPSESHCIRLTTKTDMYIQSGNHLPQIARPAWASRGSGH